MAGRAPNLREQVAMVTLRNVRSQGHEYVELREDGKRFVFFCNLCRAPCYSDSILYDHLKGHLHAERYAAAKVTLLGPNPWPFNDGVFFFHNSRQQILHLKDANAREVRLIGAPKNCKNVSLVEYGGDMNVGLNSSRCNMNLEPVEVGLDENVSSGNKISTANDYSFNVVVPGVLLKEEASDLQVRFIGLGRIAARFHENDGVSNGMSKIWCEWLGKDTMIDEDARLVPEHDFAIITFSFSNELARRGWDDDEIYLLSTGSTIKHVNKKGLQKKRKKSLSEPDDIGQTSSNHVDSSEDFEGPYSPNSSSSFDDQSVQKKIISNKSMRQELRRRQRAAANRMCDICQHKMLPGKDVAAILNLKTGKLACNSRNSMGKFHVFHTSCLIHWMLLCELETHKNHAAKPEGHVTTSRPSPKVKPRAKRKAAVKCNEKEKEGGVRTMDTRINSVFCPECLGSGMIAEGDELENPKILLSQLFRYKLKVSDGHKSWMKNPEVLQNCSTGLHIPSPSEETVEEIVKPLKLLHFYSSDA